MGYLPTRNQGVYCEPASGRSRAGGSCAQHAALPEGGRVVILGDRSCCSQLLYDIIHSFQNEAYGRRTASLTVSFCQRAAHMPSADAASVAAGAPTASPSTLGAVMACIGEPPAKLWGRRLRRSMLHGLMDGASMCSGWNRRVHVVCGLEDAPKSLLGMLQPGRCSSRRSAGDAGLRCCALQGSMQRRPA